MLTVDETVHAEAGADGSSTLHAFTLGIKITPKKLSLRSDVKKYAWNPSTQETEAGPTQ